MDPPRSPIELSILVFCASALLVCPAPAEPPGFDDPEVLTSAFEEAYFQKDWARAIELGLRLDRAQPNDKGLGIFLARVYTLHGDHDKAIEWLTKATKNGLHRLAPIENEKDFDSLRDHLGYEGVLERVRKNQERRRKLTRTKFNRKPPTVLVPPRLDSTRTAPLIIALHGYGGWAADIAEAWRGAARTARAILIAPQATRRVKGGSGFDWVDPDDAGFIVELTLEYAKTIHPIDPKRVVLTGFSQGGFMAYTIAARHPDWFAGVVPMGTGYVRERDAPSPAPEGPHPRYFFMIGESDRSVLQTKQAVEDFTAAGYEVKLRVYPKAGHVFPKHPGLELGNALSFVMPRGMRGRPSPELRKQPRMGGN